jgi:nicotinamidase-related amidase
MALTVLDPRSALILIDLQNGIVTLPAADLVEPVILHATELAEAFRAHKLPVVLVNVAGVAPGRSERGPRLDGPPPAGWSDLIPALNRQPEDHTVTKKTWGAFTNTGLADYLKQNGVTQVVIAGVSTSIGVESTARQAYELGLNVTLALDAMADMNADAHFNSVSRIFPRLGETGTTREVLALLESTRS